MRVQFSHPGPLPVLCRMYLGKRPAMKGEFLFRPGTQTEQSINNPRRALHGFSPQTSVNELHRRCL